MPVSDTLFKARDGKLDDVISEFGVPKSAAAAVMKIFEWCAAPPPTHAFSHSLSLPVGSLSPDVGIRKQATAVL